MAAPNSKATLKEYALRQLGKPVLDINVDDDQIDDIIDDALQYFAEYHYDGTIRTYLKHKINVFLYHLIHNYCPLCVFCVGSE